MRLGQGETDLHQVPFREQDDGAHVEQKNWHISRQAVGYHRYNIASSIRLITTLIG